jgi:HB1, ASXL, restriction endonuclease HTH domain
MTYLDAAVTILEAAGRPMTAAEITREALQQGLLREVHKTPAATMTAALYMHGRKGGTSVRRVALQGPQRAVRGTVRWELGAGPS